MEKAGENPLFAPLEREAICRGAMLRKRYTRPQLFALRLNDSKDIPAASKRHNEKVNFDALKAWKTKCGRRMKILLTD